MFPFPAKAELAYLRYPVCLLTLLLHIAILTVCVEGAEATGPIRKT